MLCKYKLQKKYIYMVLHIVKNCIKQIKQINEIQHIITYVTLHFLFFFYGSKQYLWKWS
jgi:hypothetical protein